MIKRNILIGLVGQGGLLVLSLLATRLVFRELGGEVLGIISFSITLTFLFIAISDMGLSLLVTREVAANRHSDAPYVEALVRMVGALSWFAFLVSALFVVFLAPILINRWVQIEITDISEATLALQVISIGLLLAIPRAAYGAVINGIERVDLWNLANLLAVTVQQVGLILVLASGGRLLNVAIWYCVSAVVGLFPFLYFIFRLCGIRFLAPKWSLAPLVRDVKFASHLFANSLTGLVMTQVDRWAISRFLPISLLGYYGFAQGLASKGGILPGVIANAAFPALSSMVTETINEDNWRVQYHKLQEFSAYAYFPVSAAVAMLGIVVTNMVFNHKIVELIWLPLVLLSIGQYLLGLLNVPYWLAVALKRPDISLYSNLWAFLVVLPGVLILTYQYGLMGAACSPLLYAAWQLVYFVPRFSAHCMGAVSAQWYGHAGPFFVIGMFSYSLTWLSAWLFGMGLTVVGLVSAYILGTIFFLVLGWHQIGQELKNTIIHSVKNFRWQKI